MEDLVGSGIFPLTFSVLVARALDANTTKPFALQTVYIDTQINLVKIGHIRPLQESETYGRIRCVPHSLLSESPSFRYIKITE